MKFKNIEALLAKSPGTHSVLRNEIMRLEEIERANGAYWAISQFETVTGHDQVAFLQELDFLESIGYRGLNREITFNLYQGEDPPGRHPLARCWRDIQRYKEDFDIQLSLRRVVNFREVSNRDYWVQYSIFPVPELYGCDGTTDHWHHARVQKVMADIGVDCWAAYREGYDGEDYGAAIPFDPAHHVFFTDDPIERANNALHDLYDLNNRSFVDALEACHPELQYDSYQRENMMAKYLAERAPKQVQQAKSTENHAPRG